MQLEKKLLYIYPYNLPYYSTSNYAGAYENIKSYIIANKDIVNNFKGFEPIHAEYRKIGNIKNIFQYIKNLDNIINNLRPEYVMTKEIFSSLSYQVSHINKNRYIHIMFIDETTNINESLWGLFPISRYYTYYNAKKNNYYIVNSKKVLNILLSFGIKSERISIIYDGVYPEKYTISTIENKNVFNLVFIGNLENNKGIVTIISAFNLLKNNNIRLHIAGTGSLKNYVMQNAEKNKNIIYHGYISEEEKKSLLSKADIFLYTSEDILLPFKIKRWEEQGAVSAIEAMASGIPIIGSSSGNMPEILGENLIIKQKDYIDLSGKIEFLLNNYDLRKKLHDYNIKRVNQLFNINNNILKFQQFLKTINL